MTIPKVRTEAEKVGGEDYRYYIDPLTGERVPGVTSILKMYAKPALVGWARKEATRFTLLNIERLADEVRRNGVSEQLVQRTAWASAKQSGGASALGTKVHKTAEGLLLQILAGATVNTLQLPTGDDPTIPFVQPFLTFLREFDATPAFIEDTVWNTEDKYAGSFDNGLRIGRFDGKLLLVDIKSGASGIWPETSLQLAAYARAGFIIKANGERFRMPPVDGAAALWLRPEGFALHPMDIGDATWRGFLALREVFEWHMKTAPQAVRPAVNAHPIVRERRG
jgi:hypothetical protein